MLTIIKVFIILFLLLEIGNTLTIPKQIIKLSFQLSIQVYPLLGQNKGERKTFLGGCKERGHIVKLSPRALGFHKG